MNGTELKKFLMSSSEIEFSNIIFNIENHLNIDINRITLKNTFINCKFSGSRIDFLNLNLSDDEKTNHILNFENCSFDNEIYFKDCSLQELSLTNITNISKLHIACKKILYLNISNDQDILADNFNFILHNCEVIKELFFRNIKSNNSYLDFIGCHFNSFSIFNCIFKRFDISNCNFKSSFEFHKNLVENSYIKNNTFSKFYFANNNLDGSLNFKSNEFEETVIFEKNKNDIRGEVKIESCNFLKYTYFNNNKLYRLIIGTTKFAETTSFQDVNIDEFTLDKTIFEKTPFFDDFSIKIIDRCSYRTIRNLKQQLLRADNSIDYNFYRSVEHTIYKKHLKNKIKDSTSKNEIARFKRDLLILKINDFFSDNGVNWVKALKKTIYYSFLIYTLFYVSYNFKSDFDLLYYNEFIVGYFKFLLVTDYNNPLIEEKKFIDL